MGTLSPVVLREESLPRVASEEELMVLKRERQESALSNALEQHFYR